MIVRRLKINPRGSLKDPLLYLGIISLFLFGFVSFRASAFLNSLPDNSSSLFSLLSISQSSDRFSNDKLFLDQEKAHKFDVSLFNILQGNTLLGASPPINISPQALGVLAGEIPGESFSDQKNEIAEYIVQSDDTLSRLAEKFDISLDTLLWANNLSISSNLKVGQKLVILPVSGLIHYVEKGETLSQIAEKYKGNIHEIAVLNDISDQEIFIGDILIVPEGIMPSISKKVATASATSPFSAPNIPLANSYFIFPTQGKISQGLHWYNAVDIAAPCGTPVYAAAQGTILKTKFSNYGLGNYIAISHPNGIVTYYGHLQSILANPGEQVSQGQIIAQIGGKPGMPGAGNSTGCHVHFDVRGARNPFAP